jgi:hypothetical protein
MRRYLVWMRWAAIVALAVAAFWVQAQSDTSAPPQRGASEFYFHQIDATTAIEGVASCDSLKAPPGWLINYVRLRNGRASNYALIGFASDCTINPSVCSGDQTTRIYNSTYDSDEYEWNVECAKIFVETHGDSTWWAFYTCVWYGGDMGCDGIGDWSK